MMRISQKALKWTVNLAVGLSLAGCLGFEAPEVGLVTTKLVFDGIQDPEVEWLPSSNRINFDWSPAINADGEVSYEIWMGVDGHWGPTPGEMLVRTKEAFWQYQIPNPEESRAMTFMVRACDSVGCEANREQVTKNITDPNDYDPPEFDGVKYLFAIAEDKIELHWDRSPSSDIGKYNIYHSYDLNNPIGSTIDDRYVVKNLSPNTRYKFVVRAQDVNNNEEKNTWMGIEPGASPPIQVDVSQRLGILTDAVDRPDFSGLIGMENLPGIPGLTRVLLRWLPTVEEIKGYRIYVREGGEDLSQTFTGLYTHVENVPQADSPISSDPEGNYIPWKTAGGQKVNYAIVDLGPSASGKQFTFVVQAYTDDTQESQERNRLNQEGGPFQAIPPTFSGISLARAADGDSGFDTGYLEWPTPQADGVYNKFRVTVDEGFCSDGFPSPTTLDLGDTVRSFNFGGLTPETQYHVKVNALYDFQNGDASDDILDPNTTCLEFYTEPESPVFAGIKTVLTAEGASGFDSLDLFWDAATKSFSWYVIDIATDVGFTNIVYTANGDSSSGDYVSQLATRETTTLLVSGLPQKTELFIRMKARFVYSVDPAFVRDSVGSFSVIKTGTTTPPAPEGDGVHSIAIIDPATLRINLNEPTNKDNGRDSALYNRYRIWKYCGAGAVSDVAGVDTVADPGTESDLMTPVSANPATGLKNFIDLVTSDVQCCYQVRALYDDGAGKRLDSISARSYQCATPKLIPPDYNGPVVASNPNDGTGFYTLSVNWTPLVADENFTRWQVQISDDPNNKSWTDNASAPYVKVHTINSNFDEGTLPGGATGLDPYKTYTVRVRGVHEFAGSFAYKGEEFLSSATTEPARPLNDDVEMEAAGATSLRLTYTPPSDGLWNHLFIWVTRYDGSENASDATWRTVTTVETNSRTPTAYKVPIDGEVDYTISSVSRTVDVAGNVPALIRVSRSAIEGDGAGPKEIIIKGVAEGQTYLANVMAAQWTAGTPDHHTQGNTHPRTARPEATPPSWGGYTIVKDATANDFSTVQFDFSPATGECAGYRVWISDDSNLDYENEAPSREVTGDCSTITPSELATTTYDGAIPLNPSTDYWVMVKAFEEIDGDYFYSSGGILTTHFTAPVTPDGDGVDEDNSSVTSIDDAPDRATVAWNNPSVGTWNKILVFKAVDPAFDYASGQNSQGAAQAAAIARANAWPGTPADFTLDKASQLSGGSITEYQDNTLLSGQWTCYVVRAAMLVDIPSEKYTVSTNEQTYCGKSNYVGFTYNGANEVERISNCSDGTAQFRIHFDPTSSIPAGASIDDWDVYYFDSPPTGPEITSAIASGPWMTVEHSDAFRTHVDVGCGGVTRSGSQYFLARYRFAGGPVTDTNNDITTPLGSNSYNNTAPQGFAHFAKVAKEDSNLGYDFFIMAFEASEKTAGSAGTEEVTWDTDKLSKCSTKFHVNKVALDSECRSTATAGSVPTRTVQSVPGQDPLTVNWHEAYWACRNSSSGNTMMRLPTEKEWRAAVRYSNYSDLVNQTADGTPSCNLNSGAKRNTKGDANCVSEFGLFDAAGNVGEWVDARMEFTTGDFPRFGHASRVFGRMISNGIDSIGRKGLLGVDYSGPRFLQIVPPGEGLALQMGSHFSVGDYTSQPGPEAHRWLKANETGATTGFRCVAFDQTALPAMDELAQPEPPRYTSADVTAGLVPANKFINDEKIERVEISGSVSGGGTVLINFEPWTKTVCTNGSCVAKPASDLSYHLYRTEEPNKWDERFVTSWALDGAGSAYANKTRLDPNSLAGGPLESTGCNAPPCSFTDNLTGDETRKMWLYTIVVEDAEGNVQYPMRQRFRTPHLAQFSTTDSLVNLGSQPGAFQWTRPFRSEVSWRRASIYPVDETYQSGTVTGVQNVMVHVPMDKSGMDRDFYIQKYEPFVVNEAARGDYNGTPANHMAPIPATSDTHVWKPDLAECMRRVYAEGTTPSSYTAGHVCAEDGFATTALGSLANRSTLDSSHPVGSMMYWGEGVRLCSNSPVEGHQNSTVKYYLRPLTSTEFYAASDFGDTDLDGVIDENPVPGNVGRTIDAVSHPPYASPYNGLDCNVWNEGGSGQADRPSSDFSNCVSRYGAVSMVGNRGEQVLELLLNGKVKDNGVDAIAFGTELSFQGTFKTGTWGTEIGKVDLNSGLPICRSSPCSGTLSDVFGWFPNANFFAEDRWSLQTYAGQATDDRSFIRGGDAKYLGGSGTQNPGRHSMFSFYIADRNYWTRCAR